VGPCPVCEEIESFFQGIEGFAFVPRCHNRVVCSWRDKSTLRQVIFDYDFIHDIVKPLAVVAPYAKINHPSIQGGRSEIGNEGHTDVADHRSLCLLRLSWIDLPHPAIAPWVETFIEEAASFPHGRHDDQVDAITQALNRLRSNKGIFSVPESQIIVNPFDTSAAWPRAFALVVTPAAVADSVSVGELIVSALSVSPSKALARPKSSTFTTPSGVILMFAGFRSR